MSSYGHPPRNPFFPFIVLAAAILLGTILGNFAFRV